MAVKTHPKPGKPLSQEHRAKISQAKKGRPHTPEHCEKIAKAARLRYARLRGEA